MPLGSDANFAVLGGQTVTNSGFTTINGDLGVSPGTAVTGFGPGVVNGAMHNGDQVAAQAQSDLTIAYNNAANRPGALALATADIGGSTIPPGIYKPPTQSATLSITGTVTLDARGNPNAVWIFQIPTTLTTASGNSAVNLINSANPCNVFWQVGSSATLNGGTTFNGNILANASISLSAAPVSQGPGRDVIVNGRLLARASGGVSLINDTVTKTGP